MGIDDVSLQTKLAGLPIEVPFFIQAMTGGSPTTAKLNRRLATIARETGWQWRGLSVSGPKVSGISRYLPSSSK